MRVKCPRCGSFDICASRRRGAVDVVLGTLGLPPRRCSACGWRGYRPAFMELMRKSGRRTPRLAGPSVEQVPNPAARRVPTGNPRSRVRARRRRFRRWKTGRRGKAFWTLLVAVVLGAAIGLGVGKVFASLS